MAKKGTGVGLEKQNESSWRLAGLSPHKNKIYFRYVMLKARHGR